MKPLPPIRNNLTARDTTPKESRLLVSIYHILHSLFESGELPFILNLGNWTMHRVNDKFIILFFLRFLEGSFFLKIIFIYIILNS